MAASDGAGPDISVVVCAYTRARDRELLEAVDSLRRQTRRPREVIVVVDHNSPLLTWVRRHTPGVTVAENGQARGLAGARNSGVRAARGEVVAFLDDDAVAAPDWIERLASAYRDSRVLGAGGAVLPVFEGGRPRWLPQEFDWVVGCSYRGLPTRPEPVRNLMGCNMSFQRAALVHAGGFPRGLGRVGADRFGCEETELCIRLGREAPKGIIVYDPAARVRHRVPRQRMTLAYFLSRCRAEGLSKAEVVHRCGSFRGLHSERAYTRRTLPAGLREGLAAGLRGDGAGLARAGAIVLGLAATATGFAAGRSAGSA
jgi:glucosyl-dolichyl phosphate glucuronosyltransferase